MLEPPADIADRPPVPIRTGPRHQRVGRAAFSAVNWLGTRWLSHVGFHQLDSSFADQRRADVRERLARNETVYLAGFGPPGAHNSGVALVEVTNAHGPRLILNNEEERFSGEKHTANFPAKSIDAMVIELHKRGRDIGDIAAWLTTWDCPTLFAKFAQTVMEEAPDSFRLLRRIETVGFDSRRLEQMSRAPKMLGRHLGTKSVPLICVPHHENHAWFSFAVSPFAASEKPVAIAVLDGTGDLGSISLYVAQNNELRRLYCNDSVFDSLGAFYTVLSSSQGGWTWLSSEGRYMGAAAWGDLDRATNRYYPQLRDVLQFGDRGEILLNRAMANWYCDPLRQPYKQPLIDVLGEPLRPEQLWNPDAMLRVEDITHRPDTQDRLDKAAATQLVFEDAVIHIVDHLLRETGADRLILTGGVALNAVGNTRLLEHFGEAWFSRTQGRAARLHLWVPPTPGDAGVTIGAPWYFAHLAGAGCGPKMTHAFYCGSPPASADIDAALIAPDISSETIGDISTEAGRDAIADLMAYMVARGGIVALYQGAAETGPRALGHRSILANPCDPDVRENLNARVKYREAIRPLAPMATLKAAQEYFELLEGASDDDYNAYNYMVLTAHSKPNAREKIPAVIHADGTGRLQIVREDDPLTYAYLLAMGRHVGVEMSVNTSFNVAGPIAQTPQQAIDTLRRSKGLDAVIMVADDGSVRAAWHGGARDSGRFSNWWSAWSQTRSARTET